MERDANLKKKKKKKKKNYRKNSLSPNSYLESAMC